MQPERQNDDSELLKIISRKTTLKEGEEGVKRLLREIFRNKKISTKRLAKLTRLPIPVTAAIRKELEKAGILARDKGVFLTEKGKQMVTKQLGFIHDQRLICPICQGRSIQIPDNLIPMLEKLRDYMSFRPKPLSWLDQTHGTPETAFLRALFMLEKGDVDGRKIIFLGDDDFTSIAVGLLESTQEITVTDIDSRLLIAIQRISDEEGLNITCIEHDLRNPLPEPLQQEHDVAFTDPPYTIPGLTLFVSRAITALKPRISASVYLAFAHQPPQSMLKMQRVLGAMGLAIMEQIPSFNVYEGAEMLANTTFLARLETTGKMKPRVVEAFDSKFYTGEVTETIRTYHCHCGEHVKVGITESVRTVEELKAKGCPTCGRIKGFKLIRKQKLKEAAAEKLVLRDFKWTDFPEVLEFEREIARKSFPKHPFLDDEYHRQKLQKALKRNPKSLKVAILDDEIVGWLWLRTEKDRNTNEKFGYIKSIIIKPKHRRQGFGRKLIDLAKHYFLNQGIHRIDLIVSATNYEATAFFEDANFKRKHSTMRLRLNN